MKKNPVIARMNKDLSSESTDLTSTDKPPDALEHSPIQLHKRRYNKAWFGKRQDSKEQVSPVVNYDNGELKLPFEFYKAFQNLRRKKAILWDPRAIIHKKWRPMMSFKPRKLTDTQNKRLSPFGLSHSNENVPSNKRMFRTYKWNVKKFKQEVAKNEKDLKRFSNHFARYIARYI